MALSAMTVQYERFVYLLLKEQSGMIYYELARMDTILLPWSISTTRGGSFQPPILPPVHGIPISFPCTDRPIG